MFLDVASYIHPAKQWLNLNKISSAIATLVGPERALRVASSQKKFSDATQPNSGCCKAMWNTSFPAPHLTSKKQNVWPAIAACYIC